MKSFISAFLFISAMFLPGKTSAKGGEGVLGKYFSSIKRSTLGSSNTTVTQNKNPNLQNLTEPWGINVDNDYGFPLGLNIGFNYFQQRPFNATWKGNANTQVEMYGWVMKTGMKIYFLSGKNIQPWFMLGGAAGMLNIAKPADRNFHDYRIGYWDVGSQFVSGAILEAGIDILFTEQYGLRLSGQSLPLWSAPVAEFGNKTYEMNLNTLSVSILLLNK